jgi:hypothetical protein
VRQGGRFVLFGWTPVAQVTTTIAPSRDPVRAALHDRIDYDPQNKLNLNFWTNIHASSYQLSIVPYTIILDFVDARALHRNLHAVIITPHLRGMQLTSVL